MARAVQRISARRDFVIHYAYLAENASIEIAKRFRDAVETTYADLAGAPRIGSPGKVHGGKYEGVRMWRVRGFHEYLIAYRERRDGVAIERLIHAKQDYKRILK